MKYKYNILSEVLITVEASSKKEAIQKAKDALGMLDVQSSRVIDDKRTIKQNASLHLISSEVADMFNEKGIAFYQLIEKPLEIPCTPENIKMLFRKLCEWKFGVISTSDLKKTGQIEAVYQVFSDIIAKRTNYEILIPPFPCLESQAKNEKSVEYPQDYNDPKF